MRRPIQITRESFDFAQSKLCLTDLEQEFETSLVYDKETKIGLAKVFLAQLDLAVELTDLISYIYPANGFQSLDKLDSKNMLLMRSKILQCKKGLDAWNANSKRSICRSGWAKKHKSFALYSGMTSIYYQCVCSPLNTIGS